MRNFSAFSTALFIAINHAGGCTLHDEKIDSIYELNLPEEQCRTIAYTDGNIIPIQLSYPQGRAESSAWRGASIIIRLYYVPSSFNYAALIHNKFPTRHEDGYEIYRISNQEKYVFKGGDAVQVIATKLENTWLAERMQRGILVAYQYERSLLSIRAADDFVRVFIEKILKPKE